MTDEEVKTLVERYEMDSGITYELSAQELQVLLAEVGEMEPVIDAINVLNGASVEQRAADIGCDPSDFREWDDNEVVSVSELEYWAGMEWEPGV
jgi:hypothetical protein